MADLVAVAMFPTFNPDRSLKREALLFDRIEVFGLSRLLEIALHWDAQEYFAEWQYLFEAGVLGNPGIEFVLSEEERERARASRIPDPPRDVLQSLTPERLEHHAQVAAEAEAICRRYAGWLASSGNGHGVYIVDRGQALLSEGVSSKDQVLNVVLKQLPLPDEATPWESVLDFRRDTDSMAKYRRLRHWINQLAEKERRPSEVEDELLYLMAEFESAMRLHNMKVTSGVVETLVVSSAEVLANLATFKWGSAAKALFSLRRQDIALIEAERSAPGREVAYMLDARRRFEK